MSLLIKSYSIFRISEFKLCLKIVRIQSYSGPHFPRISPYSARDWENVDQNNSECRHILRSEG